MVATDTVASGAGTSQLLWGLANSPPQPVSPQSLYDPQKLEPHGLTGLYRSGSSFDTPPAIGRVDPVISFYYHETVMPRPYSVEWSGKLYIPEDGLYAFGTENLSTSRLNIDGQEIINNPTINNLMENRLNLTKGLHDIQIFFQDMGDASHMYLYWTPPGRGRSIIPSDFLWPTMGQYPDKPASGAWPTLADF